MPSIPRCVYCRKRAVEDRFRPFCSQRCKMADLGRWLNGSYAVAGQPAPGTDHLPTDDPDGVDEDGRLR